jgi:hypothetical protein
VAQSKSGSVKSFILIRLFSLCNVKAIPFDLGPLLSIDAQGLFENLPKNRLAARRPNGKVAPTEI